MDKQKLEDYRGFISKFNLSYFSPKLKGIIDADTGYRKIIAFEPFKNNELVLMWGGQIITEEQVFEIPLKFRRYITQMSENLFQYTHADEPAEWINHSCDPNCGISGQVAVVTMRNIDIGEELCFDYAMIEDNDFLHEEFECNCKTDKCRKKFTPRDWKIPDLQRRYKGYFATHIQRKIDTGL